MGDNENPGKSLFNFVTNQIETITHVKVDSDFIFSAEFRFHLTLGKSGPLDNMMTIYSMFRTLKDELRR